jgi:3-oxoacyl-[acyl-carrier protein] reductase
MERSSPPVVCVTGAAGGLGQALVQQFAAQGWRVAAGYHRAEFVGIADSIWSLPLDVTDHARAAEAVQEIVARWGRLDVLVNNAGAVVDAPIWQLHEEDWDTVMAVNLKGAFRVSQAALRPMLRQREGHIVNIASFAARSGPRSQAPYAAAKAGLVGLTQSLAREVGSCNVRVNAVLPGVLPTPMTAHLDDAVIQEFARANVLGRLNSVAEVARFVVFLAAMQNVSGQLFQLDSRIARWT